MAWLKDYSMTRLLSGFFTVASTVLLVLAMVAFWGMPELFAYYVWYSGFASMILTLYGAKSLTQKKINGGEKNVVSFRRGADGNSVDEGSPDSRRASYIGR